MMKQTRPPTPEYLRRHYKVWGHRYDERLTQDPKHTFRWPPIDGKTVNTLLMADLEQITQHHCAYCDVNILGAASRRTIDHFRPKRRFPMLAYAWPNLFLCCDTCQQAKGEQYTRRLLKPDIDGYQFERYFIVNFDTGKIDVNPAATDDDKVRADETIRVFDLNSKYRKKARKLELMRGRGDLPLDDLPYRFLYGS